MAPSLPPSPPQTIIRAPVQRATAPPPVLDRVVRGSVGKAAAVPPIAGHSTEKHNLLPSPDRQRVGARREGSAGQPAPPMSGRVVGRSIRRPIGRVGRLTAPDDHLS